ncbi:MAG: hypothetical protein LBB80_11600 [Treponema sp.]|jgi:hypothetical protein|nr:hypothetical protein [Treponema sp.]
MIIERKSKKVLDVQEVQASTHDFKLYKDTIGKEVDESILIQANLGYLWIEKLHPNSQIPKKASKLHLLNKGEKAYRP